MNAIELNARASTDFDANWRKPLPYCSKQRLTTRHCPLVTHLGLVKRRAWALKTS